MEFSFSSDFRSRQTRGLSTYAACSSVCQHSNKTDFNLVFSGTNLLNEISKMENPLQKNLADTFSAEKMNNNTKGDLLFSEGLNTENSQEMPHMQKNAEGGWRAGDFIPTIFGVTNIITGLFKQLTNSVIQATKHTDLQNKEYFLNAESSSVTTNMDHKDPEFDDWSHDEPDASPSIDDDIKHLVPLDSSKNRIEARENTAETNIAQCRARGGRAAASPVNNIMPLPALVDPAETCQAKMAKIKELLAGKCPSKEKSKSTRYRPKKIFIDPKFVQEKTVESFEPEVLERLESVDTTDFVNPGVITPSNLIPAEILPRVKLVNDVQIPAANVTEETKPIENETRNLDCQKLTEKAPNNNLNSCAITKVEEKINGDLTQDINTAEKFQTNNDVLILKQNSVPLPEKGSQATNAIVETPKKPICLPEIKNVEDLIESNGESSIESSPKITVTPPEVDGFNEFTGKFESTSPLEHPDDSFMIVFSDVPVRHPRQRIPSDTSEDSFIVFEDDPEGCKECFVVEDSCESDADTDNESNLDRMGKFSQTQMDLTNESLYCDPSPEVQVPKRHVEKKVRFSEKPPQVRVMRVWEYAARQARIGTWRQTAADAERFKRRIADVEMAISWVLKAQHRNRVKFQRFMPWWNQQRRIEEAQKKEEEERRRLEEEERIEEERRIEMEVRMEFENSRKKKKRVTTQQFARNFAAYLLKMKQDKESEKSSSNEGQPSTSQSTESEVAEG